MASQALAQALVGLLTATPAPHHDSASAPRSRSPRRRSRERRRSPSPPEVAAHPELDSFSLEKLEAVALHPKQHRTMQMCRPDQVASWKSWKPK